MVEKAYFIFNVSELKKLPADAARVYLGSEYCIRAYPENLEKLILRVKLDLPVTLLVPPLPESELKTFFKFLDIFKRCASDRDEVVINDWGVFHQLSNENERAYSLSLGRFFSYQKRGTQMLYDAVSKEDLSHVPILNGQMVIFLKEHGVERVEIDAPKYGLLIKKCPDIKISVYEPYALNSYTLNCPHTFDGKSWRRKCGRNCLTEELIYSGGDAAEGIIQKGKAYHTKSHFISHPCVDRVVNIQWKTL